MKRMLRRMVQRKTVGGSGFARLNYYYEEDECLDDPEPWRWRMVVDLTILPLRGGRHISDEVAEVIKLIDASGLPYQLTPSGTCIEGAWDTVMPLIQRCHAIVRSMSSHVVTIIKIEEEYGKENKLTTNITSIEQRLGRSVGRTSKLVSVGAAPSDH